MNREKNYFHRIAIAAVTIAGLLGFQNCSSEFGEDDLNSKTPHAEGCLVACDDDIPGGDDPDETLDIPAVTKGKFDQFFPYQGKVYASGWACIHGDTAPVTVSISMNGTKFASGLANYVGEAAVNVECGTSGVGHRYNIEMTPDIRKNYAGQTIEVKVGTIVLPALTSAVIPTGQLMGVFQEFLSESGKTYASGWACAQGVARDIEVSLHVNGNQIATGLADLASPAAVNTSCGTPGAAHNFKVELTPAHLQAYKGQSLLIRVGAGTITIQAPPNDDIP